MALKKFFPDVRFGANKVQPDEMDVYQQYVISHPSVDPVWFGTAVGTQTTTQALGVINRNADYPRNMVYAIAAAAGSARGGSITVNGKNQFGATVSETVAISPANGGGTVAGTQVFAQFTSGSVTFGTGDAGSGTARLGVAIGTSATLQHRFGLPTKIAAVSDVKSVLWINNGTATTTNGGTVDSTLVGTSGHTFNGTAVVAVTDRFVVNMKSTYNAENDLNPLANL